jgi:HlyD family secretion protein
MNNRYRVLVLLTGLVLSAFLLWPATKLAPAIRVTGTIQAINTLTVQVPIMEGQGGNLTLVRLVENGTTVRVGDLLAEFDSTSQIKLAREAQAKYDDLTHQVEQKQAEHNNNSEKRLAELAAATADLKKAEIELRKGPILSEIEQQKNLIKQQDAKEHVASLQKSGRAHDEVEIAEIHVLELQRDRQKVAMQRQATNAQRLSVKAPIAGMVALQNVFRNNSLGHAEEGDQLWPGSLLLQLFDPTHMQVALSVGEPDGAVLHAGTQAMVHIDAFPELSLPAHFDSASPIASSSLGNPIKTFNARFVLDRTDKRLMPDLSAAAEIQVTR